MAITRPTNHAVPFADAGTKNTIPTPDTGTGKASYTTGFPPVTMMPISSGGIPPEGKDFNGILYDITSHTIWVNAGGQYLFDAALSTAIGGYPAGMVLQSNDGLSAYVSLANANTVDFNSTPASIGVLWGPWAGEAILTAGRPIYVPATIASELEVGTTYLVDTTAGAFPLLLPSAPVAGNFVHFVDCFGTQGTANLTLNRNGKTIMGVADNLVCDVAGLEFRAIYNGTTWGLQ